MGLIPSRGLTGRLIVYCLSPLGDRDRASRSEMGHRGPVQGYTILSLALSTKVSPRWQSVGWQFGHTKFRIGPTSYAY
jgi:hypothetical protein